VARDERGDAGVAVELRQGDRELFALLTVLTWIMHRANIARLVQGTEGKIGNRIGKTI
jgi:glycerol-3-phosphate acyltransferase PlsY